VLPPQGEPASPLRHPRRPAMGPGAGRAHHHRHRPRPASPPAPFRCFPPPRIYRSRTSTRCS
jgi:hypothetical protein